MLVYRSAKLAGLSARERNRPAFRDQCGVSCAAIKPPKFSDRLFPWAQFWPRNPLGIGGGSSLPALRNNGKVLAARVCCQSTSARTVTLSFGDHCGVAPALVTREV